MSLFGHKKGETMGLTVGSNQDNFNYKVISQFAIVTVLWGICWHACGVILAAQLIWPEITFNIPWLSYGRLRPLHTNAVILLLVVRRYSQRLITLFSAPAKYDSSVTN